MNNYLIIELLREWFVEENFALNSNNQDLVLALVAARSQLYTLRRELNEALADLQAANSIVNTHVDMNFQLQERIEYLENFIIRLRDFPRPMSAAQARRQLFTDSSTDSE
jgi:hypothetical protein